MSVRELDGASTGGLCTQEDMGKLRVPKAMSE